MFFIQIRKRGEFREERDRDSQCPRVFTISILEFSKLNKIYMMPYVIEFI